ncbi:Major facilitator superfamily [Macleaya cordata]|uniref:Major facilitator superfamily n=1 Tax=Macleaya cordata TaxID=56857 RepID=A0A200QE08_MACCD|nr:Major facilitator superfamily [Macleaya cordata]
METNNNNNPQTRRLPPGFNLLLSATKISFSERSIVFYRISVLVITFSAYAAFHASRKPPSIVKSVFTTTTPATNGWAPFDGERGTHRLGELDLAFLSAYSVGMYFSGHVGDRIDLRLFLTSGMLLSGVFTILFGLGYWWEIHKLGFFLAVQIVSGLFQSIGWPCVVAVVGNWFGKSKRGLIMGIWNSQTSVGNILGSVLASSVLEYGWGWSFVLPGVFIILVGVLVFMFLVVSPEVAGFESRPGGPTGHGGKEIELNNYHQVQSNIVIEEESSEKGEEEEKHEDEAGLLQSQSQSQSQSDSGSATVVVVAVGFLEAWRLPGVAPYSFCLFFSKLVAYTFLYWLPFYISHTSVAGVHLSHKTAGILSTIFDVGGVLGGISAGYISDRIEARAVTSIMFLSFSIPALILYRIYGSISIYTNVGLMLLSGLLVNGPYSLITTAVAADLGTQSLNNKGNSRALATVTAIIDGTGSVGAALGPLLTGYISTRGWNSVFVMLILAILLAGLFLIQLAKAEVISKMNERKWLWHSIATQ